MCRARSHSGFYTTVMLTISLLLFSIEVIVADILGPGVEAPTFSMPSLSGKRESLRIWCGEPLLKPFVNDKPHTVIISFWATYCKPCHKEIPELHKFFEKHQNDQVMIFLVSIDEKGAGVVVPFAKENNYTLPILFDPYKKTAERYGVSSLPALFVVDPKGIIRYSSVGYKEDISITETLEGVLTAIKEGKEVAVQKQTVVGDTVAIRNEQTAPKQPVEFTAKQKWNAVARIECGTSPDVVANELNVSKEELRKWYKEIKDAALELWGGNKE